MSGLTRNASCRISAATTSSTRLRARSGAWTGILGTLGPRLLRGLAMAAVGLVLWLVVTWLLHALRSSRFHRTQVDVFAELIDPRDALPADPAMIPARPQPQQKR
jgi:hypothetical protein